LGTKGATLRLMLELYNDIIYKGRRRL